MKTDAMIRRDWMKMAHDPINVFFDSIEELIPEIVDCDTRQEVHALLSERLGISAVEARSLGNISVDFLSRQGREFISRHGENWRENRGGSDIEADGATLYRLESTGEVF